jgi:S1-C subfamily serine protease
MTCRPSSFIIKFNSILLFAFLFYCQFQFGKVYGESNLESLLSLQKKLIATSAKIRPSVVLITWRHHDYDDTSSGVILSDDGYIVTSHYMAYRPPSSRETPHIPPGQAVTVRLSDGRKARGVVVGNFSQEVNLTFDIIKILDPGSWPAVTIGQTSALQSGDVCLTAGYPKGPNDTYDQEPSMRIGHVIPWKLPGMLRTSCTLRDFADRGGGVFDLEGSLVGIHLFQAFWDEGRGRQFTSANLDIKIVEKNWKKLIEKNSPLKTPNNDQPIPLIDPKMDDRLHPIPNIETKELTPIVEKIRQSTVALVTFPKQSPIGCSGTIISADGYIATCAHHDLGRGTKSTVYFENGKTASATILGRDRILDIGLAKITDPGPWPFIPLEKVKTIQPDDVCISAGYPNELRRKGKVPLEVRGARIVDVDTLPAEFLVLAKIRDGDSGGGLFNTKGQLLGVVQGRSTPRRVYVYSGAEGFTTLWKELVEGPSITDPAPFANSALAQDVKKLLKNVPSIVCEVLDDGKRKAWGTIMSEDGDIVTKASEFYGTITCKLADGRVLPAKVKKIVKEHDLALLKIEATGLPKPVWSTNKEIHVGTLTAALSPNQSPSVGIVSYQPHTIAPAKGYLGIRKLKNAQGGVEVEQLSSWWDPDVAEDKRNDPDYFESPLEEKDVILSIADRAVPDMATLNKLTKILPYERGLELPFVIAGDPIELKIRRDGKEIKIRFPLLSEAWDVRDRTSPRNSSFPKVFESDVILAREKCGGPLVNCNGELIGVTIAVPVSLTSQSSIMPRVFVIPSDVVRSVIE